MYQKAVTISFFIDHCAQNFSLPENLRILFQRTVFSTKARNTKPMSSQFDFFF